MTPRSKTHPFEDTKTDLPALGGPAQRALFNAKINTLEQLSRRTKKEVSSLHGIGPSSMKPLEQALKKAGLKFKE